MEVSVTELAAQVRQEWLTEGLSITDLDLAQIPTALRDRLTPDFLTFLAVAGLPDEPDSKSIEFWSPGEWEEVADSLLLFADYMISAYCYGVWLSGIHEGKVSLFLGLDADSQPVIGNFAEFLVAYLADSAALHP